MIPMLTEKVFSIADEQLVKPLIEEILTATNTALGLVAQLTVTICGVVPFGGSPMCAQITAVITATLNSIMPPMVQSVLNLAWSTGQRVMKLRLDNALKEAFDSMYYSQAGQNIRSVNDMVGDFATDAQRWLVPLAPLFDAFMQGINPEAMANLERCDAYLDQVVEIARGGSACAPPPPPPPPRPPALKFADGWFHRAWVNTSVPVADVNNSNPTWSNHHPMKWDEETQAFVPA